MRRGLRAENRRDSLAAGVAREKTQAGPGGGPVCINPSLRFAHVWGLALLAIGWRSVRALLRRVDRVQRGCRRAAVVYGMAATGANELLPLSLRFGSCTVFSARRR